MQTHLKDIEGHYPDTRTLPEKDARALFTQYLKAKKTALRPELAQAWETFVHCVAKSRSMEMNRELCAVIKTVQEADIMPSFMQQIFDKCWAEAKGNPSLCVASIQKELEASKEVIEKIRASNVVLHEWQDKIDRWSEPEAFDVLEDGYSYDFLPVALDPQWTKWCADRSTTDLSRTMILRFIERVTEVMDLSIKSMKGSTSISDEKKVEQFGMLLWPYFDLMSEWIKQIPQSEVKEWNKQSNRNFSMNELIDQIRKVLEKCSENTELRMLYPTQGFSVANAVIGSGASFARAFTEISPNLTLEDLFTLIHQNILQALSTLRLSKGNELLSKLPDSLRDVCEGLLEYPYQESRKLTPHLLSIDFSNISDITVIFNIPLNNHSSTIEVHYNQQTKETNITLNLIGQNDTRGQRMQMALLTGALQGLAKGMVLKEVPERVSAMHHRISFDCPEATSKETIAVYASLINVMISVGTSAFTNWKFERLIQYHRKIFVQNFCAFGGIRLLEKTYNELSSSNKKLMLREWVYLFIPHLFEENQKAVLKEVLSLLPKASFQEYVNDCTNVYKSLHADFRQWYLKEYWPEFFADHSVPIRRKMEFACANKLPSVACLVDDPTISDKVKWIILARTLEKSKVNTLLDFFLSNQEEWKSGYSHPLQILTQVAVESDAMNSNLKHVNAIFTHILEHAKPSQEVMDDLLLVSYSFNALAEFYLQNGAKLNIQKWKKIKDMDPEAICMSTYLSVVLFAESLFKMDMKEHLFEILKEVSISNYLVSISNIAFKDWLKTDYMVAYFSSPAISEAEKMDTFVRYTQVMPDKKILLNYPEVSEAVKWRVCMADGIEKHVETIVQSYNGRSQRTGESSEDCGHPLQIILAWGRPNANWDEALVKIAERTTISQEVLDKLLIKTFEYPLLARKLLEKGAQLDLSEWQREIRMREEKNKRTLIMAADLYEVVAEEAAKKVLKTLHTLPKETTLEQLRKTHPQFTEWYIKTHK